MKLTGARLAKRDELLHLRRINVISAQQYKQRKSFLEKKEANIQGKKEVKKEVREVAKVAAKVARKASKLSSQSLRINEDGMEGGAMEVWSFFKEFAKKLKEGEKIYFDFMSYTNGFVPIKTKVSFEMSLDKSLSASFSNYIHTSRQILKLGSDDMFILVGGSTMTLSRFKRVGGKRAIQNFREGVVNCFMEPIIRSIEERKEGKTKNTIRVINTILKVAYAFASKYADSGVPEEDILEICQKLKISVYIKNILNGDDAIYNTKARFHFSFTNTRLNHVEIGQLVMNGKPQDVTEDQMMNMIDELDRKGSAYVIDGKSIDKKPRMVRTMSGVFRLFDDKARLMDEQFKKYSLDLKAVDACKFPILTDYLHSAYNVNSTPVFLSSNKAVSNLDMKKAYAQFKNTSFYQGFPGKINRYVTFSSSVDADFLKKNVGIYTGRVKSIKFDLPLRKILKGFGISTGSVYTLPGAEFLLFMKIGVEFEILAGAWGSSFDMEFSEEFVESGVFREWSGRLGMDNANKVYTFPTRDGYNQEFAEDLAFKNPNCSIFYNRYNDSITMNVPKTYRPTFFHIAAFITSYTRINILEKILDIGIQNVCLVMLDGIYSTKKVADCSMFLNKKVTAKSDTGAKWYYPSPIPSFTLYDGVYGNTCLLGAGGSGKTYSILESSSYHKVLYVSPTRMLGTKMQEKTSCKWTTACKFVGIDTEGRQVRKYIDEHPRINVVLLDELTMMSAEMVACIVKICKDNDIMLLMAGDIEGKQWFQTKNGDGEKMYDLYDITGWKVKEFKIDWRAKKCSVLKDFKVKLRDVMRKVFTNGGRADCSSIETWVSENVSMTPYHDAVRMFKDGDFWIAPTHRMSEKLIKDNVCSGYRIKHAATCSDAVFRERGEVVSCDVGASSEKRGSFTTHSCQGLTISSRLYINVFGSFDYSMLYTAISRAEAWNQLVFVWNF